MENVQSYAAGFSLERLPGYRRVLLLQGPVGPFFSRLANLLELRGSRVTKVNFNSGDDWFYPQGEVIRFVGKPDQWPAFLQALLAEGSYEAIFLFGDCRPIHRQVGKIAAGTGCAVWVFEEGYFRPSYITLERGGVNGFSGLLKLDLDQLRKAPVVPIPEPALFPNPFQQMAWQAFLYFLMMAIGSWRYPFYVHHRPGGLVEAFRWIRSWLRKTVYSRAEKKIIAQILSAERKKRFFVFPLQVHNDAQLCSHSDSPGVHLSLRHVMKSFAQNGSREDWLVIKHHPMDRGHTNYRKVIQSLTSEFGLAGRVQYIHDVRLPTLFDHCKGLVTVNSTAGLQGMDHGLPVITLGRSFYNKPGLTYQGGLDSFWKSDWKPDCDLYVRFRAWTITRTQINSSFYADPTCGTSRRLAPDRAPAAHPAPARLLGSPAINRDSGSIRPAVALQSEPGTAMPGC
jgi:capsular polysaccharide export protein